MHIPALLVNSAICFNSVARGDRREDFENALTTLDKVVYLKTLSAKNFAKVMYDIAIKTDGIAEIYYKSLKHLASYSKETVEQLKNEDCRDTTEVTKLEISSSQELSTTFGTFVYNIKLLERGVWNNCDDLGKIVQNLEDRFKDCPSSSCERDVIDDVQREIRNFPAKTDLVKAEYETQLSTYVANFIEYGDQFWQTFSKDIGVIVMEALDCEQNKI